MCLVYGLMKKKTQLSVLDFQMARELERLFWVFIILGMVQHTSDINWCMAIPVTFWTLIKQI
jgi:hypothetical protein